MLVAAFLRRKKWEYRSQAVAIMNALGESMGGGNKTGSYINGYREVSPEEMLSRIGGG